jgi:hypothetical protein
MPVVGPAPPTPLVVDAAPPAPLVVGPAVVELVVEPLVVEPLVVEPLVSDVELPVPAVASPVVPVVLELVVLRPGASESLTPHATAKSAANHPKSKPVRM